MHQRYVRTAAGQAEIQSRALNLARPVRNLLLVLSADKPAEFWLSQVRGCTADDLQRLVAEGLVAPTEAQRPAAPASAPAAAGGPDLQQLQQLVRQSAYAPLYAALNTHAKEALGLVGGYRFVLEVERCSGPAELQDLGLRYLQQLADKHGQAALRRFGALLDRA